MLQEVSNKSLIRTINPIKYKQSPLVDIMLITSRGIQRLQKYNYCIKKYPFGLLSIFEIIEIENDNAAKIILAYQIRLVFIYYYNYFNHQ